MTRFLLWLLLALVGGFATWMGAWSARTLADALVFSGMSLAGHWLYGEEA